MILLGNQTTGLLLQTMLFLTTQNTTKETDTNTLYHVNIGEDNNHPKCYGVYGCYPISAPWTSEHRPVSMFPESPEKINPGFLVYLNHKQKEPIMFDIYDSDAVKLTGMNPRLSLYVISHGYLESGYKTWIRDLRLELLSRERCTVIVIDWQGGSSPPYAQAVANIRLVGAMFAHLLEMVAMHTGSMQLDNVHLIGHSLGAHLSAYIGYTLQRDFNLTVARISGLDPAEPHFAKASAPVRLGPSAAKFVDVIHTDASAFIRGGLGIIEKVGHVDFYPNGGTDQPGCDQGVVQYINAEQGSFFKGMRRFLGCNHIRSYEYFTESISSPCGFMAMSCSSYQDFKNGKCFDCDANDHQCIKFGYHSIKSYQKLVQQKKIEPDQRLVLYLMTGANQPYCRAHYRLTVTISNSTESRLHGGEIGQLWFIVHKNAKTESGNNSGRFALNYGRYHEPGKTYSTVVPGDFVSEMKAVSLEWQYHSSMFNPLTWRLLAVPRIYVDKVTVDGMESHKSIIVCPKQQNSALLSLKPQIWLPSYCKK